MAKRKIQQVEDEEKAPPTEEVVPTKVIRTFSAKEFRSNLHGSGAIKIIQSFCSLAEASDVATDVVIDYLDDGGSVMELVSLLDITAQADLASALPVFRAIYVILLRIQQADEKYVHDALKGVEKLLSTFVPAIQAMIALNSAKHRKVVFKMLTAIVTVYPSFGREILNWMSLKTQQIEQLIEHGPVRKSFVMFLLAFFVEGKASNFTPLMEKKGLLSDILPGLMYDDANTVCVVLNILREKALQNPNVTKTLKLNVFNTQVLQSLFGLLDWIGPQGAQKGFKKPKRVIRTDQEDKSLVTAATIEFLRVLCTNKKYGIVFWDKTVGIGSPMNLLLLTVLQGIPKPWEKEELSQLVVEILLTSPDLIKSYLPVIEPFFQPRESSTWTKAVLFLAKIVNELNITAIMDSAAKVLTQTQIQVIIRTLCLPPIVTKYMGSACTSEMSTNVRYHALFLLSVSLKKLNGFLGWLQSNEGWELKNKKLLLHPLLKVLPSTNDIRHLWHDDEKEETDGRLAPPAVSEVRNIVADYILQVSLLDPGLQDTPRKLCRLVTKDIEVLDDKVKVNVLQAVSLLDPSFLAPDSELFEEALKTLILLSFSDTTKLDSLAAAARTLLSTGLFDSNIHEVDCWAGAWLAAPESSQLLVAEVIVSGVKKAISGSYINGEDAENDLQCGTSTPTELFPVVFISAKEHCLSKQNKKQLMTFFTNITLKLLHLYGPSQVLTQNCKRNQDWLLIDIDKYINQKDANLLLDPFEKEICSWLLGCSEENLDLSKFAPDLFQWSGVFNMILFYLKQWLLREEFSAEAQLRSKQIIKLVMEAGNPQSNADILTSDFVLSLSNQSSKVFFHKCLHSLLADPLLVNYFWVMDKKHPTKSCFTKWLKEVIIELQLHSKKNSLSSMLTPWVECYISQLQNTLESKNPVATSPLRFWMEFLQPSAEKLLSLLDIMCFVEDNEDFPSGWGDTFYCIISSLKTGKMSPKLLKTLGNTIQQAIKGNNEKGEEFGEALLCLLENFPMAVFHLESDFLETVTRQTLPTNSIITAAGLYLQLPGKADRLLQIACDIGSDSYNPNCIFALLDIVINQEGYQSCRGVKVHLSNEIEFIWPTEIIAKKIKEQRKEIEEQLLKAFSILYSALSKSISKFLRGHEIPCFSDHLGLLRILIQLYFNDPQEQKRKRKSLLRGPPKVPALMVDILRKVSDIEEKKLLLLNFVEFLCFNAKDILHVEVMRNLAHEVDIPEAWASFAGSSMFKEFVENTLRHLSPTEPTVNISLICAVLSAKWTNNEDLANDFHKCASHSEFLNIMLSTNEMKVHVVELLLRLVRRCPHVMTLGQVPAFLAAYTASLSRCDQLILLVLQEYEQHCGSLSKFEPLFWGPPAVNHYSVRGSVGLSLWRQVTMKSVLELLDLSKLKKTISNFPINRCLQGGDLESCDVYDPAFLLPLFSNLFSPGAVTYCQTFIHKGALSLTIAALSSEDRNMRAAAAVVLSRFYSHLQLVQHSKQKPVWLHVLDSVRFGLDDLEKKAVPCLVTVFLAHAVLELAEPLGALYSIHNFLLAKPTLNLLNFPEFLPLFFSAEHNNKRHRSWILEILLGGMRRETDLNMAVNGPAFKIILSSFESSLVSIEEKKLILQVLIKMVHVSNSSRIILGFGLLSWLRHVCGHLEEHLRESFLILVAEVNHLIMKEKRLTRIPLQNRLNVVLRMLISWRSTQNSISTGDYLKKVDETFFYKSSKNSIVLKTSE